MTQPNYLDLAAERVAMIKLAEECGLTFTGEYEEGQPQFIGDSKAWNLFTSKNK
jgi:hypothetical protein